MEQSAITTIAYHCVQVETENFVDNDEYRQARLWPLYDSDLSLSIRVLGSRSAYTDSGSSDIQIAVKRTGSRVG